MAVRLVVLNDPSRCLVAMKRALGSFYSHVDSRNPKERGLGLKMIPTKMQIIYWSKVNIRPISIKWVEALFVFNGICSAMLSEAARRRTAYRHFAKKGRGKSWILSASLNMNQSHFLKTNGRKRSVSKRNSELLRSERGWWSLRKLLIAFCIFFDHCTVSWSVQIFPNYLFFEEALGL